MTVPQFSVLLQRFNMKLITRTLLLCLALALSDARPGPDSEEDDGLPDRCAGIEFDAVTLDEYGSIYFFKAPHLWRGIYEQPQLANSSFKELDDLHQMDHVDAAFLMHDENNKGDHDHVYFFLDDKVFSYYNHTLEDGYPKQIGDDFPGVPSHLDAAVGCPEGDCANNSVLFFKGNDVYVYDIPTKTVKTETWAHMPVCSAAVRWRANYYCFHGHNFTRFDPVTGEVEPIYPKDQRHYFMKCPGFGYKGTGKAPKCSELKLDAIATDEAGELYSFIGIYHLGHIRDGLHGFGTQRSWPEVTNGAVDAVFFHGNDPYLIKDDKVYAYKDGTHYTLVAGYPKTLKEGLGVEGHVDAAFVCPNEHVAYLIQGDKLLDVDLTATPRVVREEVPLPVSNIDAAMCNAEGVLLFKGPQYYKYESPRVLAVAKIAPEPLAVTAALTGCREE